MLLTPEIGETRAADTPRSRQKTAFRQAPTDASAVRITLNGLNKRFGERRVLDALDLDIQPGEFVAIVGRSGCGKSTLLRLLAGLDQPSAPETPTADGAVRTRDAIKFDGAARRRDDDRVRIMFQESRLLPWKSVLDNVALGLPWQALGAATRILRQVGLGDRGREWPAALSGGQRQRVALARALVHRPKLLLLDEPLGALDALTRIGMQQLIEGLWRRDGFTAVLVTHDVNEAVALADRVLVIEEGRIALDEHIALPRPRARGSAAFAALEERILNVVLQREDAPPETTPAREPAIPFGRLRLAI
jgi:sulfonate transport system ATP-binding protein